MALHTTLQYPDRLVKSTAYQMFLIPSAQYDPYPITNAQCNGSIAVYCNSGSSSITGSILNLCSVSIRVTRFNPIQNITSTHFLDPQETKTFTVPTQSGSSDILFIEAVPYS